MSAVIYVETTIPSFYFETRTNPEVRIRRQWTREWWDSPKADHRLVTSFIVIQELEEIPGIKKDDALDLIHPLRLLEYTEDVADIVRVYLEHKLMPREVMGDADHLALASFHKCDMLVTWNCLHLANANKMGHIRRINALLGLETPLLVTPLELLGRTLMNAKRDEPLEEIWAARRRIAERFGFDPHKQARQLRHRQEEARERIYRREHDMPAASQTIALHETPPDQKPE